VNVIVGGSSVMYGTGQSADKVWVRRLQAELGDDYRVLNLAVPGGFPHEFAAIVAEALEAEYPRLLLVMDGGRGKAERRAQFPGEGVYGFLYWDAVSRNALAANPAREEQARLGAARKRESPKEEDAWRERRRRWRLGRWLGFNELWHGVSYQYRG